MVDAMAKLMSTVLHLRNFEIQNGKTPLGTALYLEKERFPTREQLDALEEVQHALVFVYSAEALCNALNTDARLDRNVNLRPYSHGHAFNSTWCFLRPRGRKKSKLRVGGISGALYLDARRGIIKWLLECDRVMNTAYNDLPESGDDEGSSLPSQLLDLAVSLADAIARRIACMPNHSGSNKLNLSTTSLQARAAAEVERTSAQAGEAQRADLAALQSFHAVATHGGNSPIGRYVLENNLDHIQHVLQTQLIDLGVKGANTTCMKLDLLAKACAQDVDIDIDVRCAIAHQWQSHYGASAATASRRAIQQINALNNAFPKPFIQVLQSPPLPGDNDVVMAPPAGCLMPLMPFVNVTHHWRFVPTTEQRSGLDLLGRRVVRLISMMLQLLGHGAIECGVIASRLVIPVVLQGSIEARYVRDLLRLKSESCSMGTSLLKFCEDVTDCESHLTDEISDAMTHVSLFSTNEIVSIFHNQSPAIRLIMDEFTIRTRIALCNCRTPVVPARYTAFAYDAMAIVLPMITHRRERTGVSVQTVQTPVLELLKRLPVVRDWHPLKGTLRLTNDDIKATGTGLLKLVLDELAARGLLVQYKRPYLGAGKLSPKMAYVFDTVQLVSLFNGRVFRQ